jgi:hypothetical protein
MSNFEWMDEEMEALVDSANCDANAKAMEEANEFHVLSQDVDEVVESAEKSYKRMRGDEQGEQAEAELFVIFVTPSSIEHLKYVQSMRKFLKKEARKMVAKLLAERAQKGKGKKKARLS